MNDSQGSSLLEILDLQQITEANAEKPQQLWNRT